MRHARPLRAGVAALAAAAVLAAACGGSEQSSEPVPALGTLPDDFLDSLTSAPSTTVSEPEGDNSEADLSGGDPHSAQADDDPVLDVGPPGDADAVGDPEAVGDGESVPGGGIAADTGTALDGESADDAVRVTDEGTYSDRTRPSVGTAASEDSTEAAGEPAVADDAPEPVPQGPIAALTGVATTDAALSERRALAVKVDNGERRSRPQAGLASADVVYEELVEAARTRFLAVFHSQMPARIGPVRSVRSGDFDLLADLSTPYLVSSGANATVLSEMRRAERAGTLIDIGGLRDFGPYSRDPARRAPFNMYFHYPELADASGALPGGSVDSPVAPLFEYGPPADSGIADAGGVSVSFGPGDDNVASHVWDAQAGGWVRLQQGDLLLTETESGAVEIAPANVVVVWIAYDTSLADRESPQAVSHGSGDALVLTAGTVHDAVWERSDDRVGFRFHDAAGDPLQLSPGATWVLLANRGGRFVRTTAEVLTVSEAAELLEAARADASSGGNSVA